MESRRMLSRRTLLQQMAGFTGILRADQNGISTADAPSPISAEDDEFLEELEHANFSFFWEQADPRTGLVKDRCNLTAPNPKDVAASIAATGFGLTALCVGQKRGYISYKDAHARTIAALDFFWKKM